MSNMPRLFLTPDYGEPAPEVIIGEPQILNPEDVSGSRSGIEAESVRSLIAAWGPLYCMRKMNQVQTEEFEIVVDEEGAQTIPVRVYRPSGRVENALPTLIFFHGGGFCMNNADVYDQVYRYLAGEHSLLVVAPDYRLAPEYRFPAAPEDCYQAVQWVIRNAEELGSDRHSVVICGDSAGGNLAAVVALMSRDRRGPRLAGQVLIYPVVVTQLAESPESERHYGEGFFLEYDSTARPMSVYVDEVSGATPYASPLLAESLEGLPNTLFISAECDPLLDQGLMFCARLEDSGVEFDYLLQRGMIHGFINMPYRQTFETLDAIGGFVQAISTSNNIQ